MEFIKVMLVVDVYAFVKNAVGGDYEHPLKKEQEYLYNLTKCAENTSIEYVVGSDPNLVNIDAYLTSNTGIKAGQTVLLRLEF